MAIEIERKFLVDHRQWNAMDKPAGKVYRQGYITADAHKTVRVRYTDSGGFLTIKGKTTGVTRSEFEYAIPLADARQLLDTLAESELSKTRYEILYHGKLWEVDVFHGDNKGLIVAEIELGSEDEPFDRPAWVKEEVTGEERYYNAQLTRMPFCKWE